VKKEKVTQDRSHAVDAALVRVMKARKKMQYKDLVLEIITLMRTFKPDDTLIKKRVASLVERDYLELDKNDENLIIYKA
jgi:cullin 1